MTAGGLALAGSRYVRYSVYLTYVGTCGSDRFVRPTNKTVRVANKSRRPWKKGKRWKEVSFQGILWDFLLLAQIRNFESGTNLQFILQICVFSFYEFAIYVANLRI